MILLRSNLAQVKMWKTFSGISVKEIRTMSADDS